MLKHSKINSKNNSKDSEEDANEDEKENDGDEKNKNNNKWTSIKSVEASAMHFAWRKKDICIFHHTDPQIIIHMEL